MPGAAAYNKLALPRFALFKCLAEPKTHGHAARLYHAIGQTLINALHSHQTFADVVPKLASLADHAYAFRQLDIVTYAGDLLWTLPVSSESASVGAYYHALGLNNGGLGNTADAGALFERIADDAPSEYRVRAMLALGANAVMAGDRHAATSFYREALRVEALDRPFDPTTVSVAVRMNAAIRGIDGDHHGSVADLERMIPLARMARSQKPHLYYDYLNSLAVELAEVGRLEEAKHASEIALLSPFARSYPVWRDTFDAIAYKERGASRAVVAVNDSGRASSVREYVEESEQNFEHPTTSAETIAVIEKVRRLTTELIAHLKLHEHDLDRVRSDVFEHLVGEFLSARGFYDVRLVARNPRTAADIYAAFLFELIGIESKYFVEVKRWKDKVGIEVIERVVGAMVLERPQHGWHAAMVVTSAGFRDFERYNEEKLQALGVELKDRAALRKWLRDYEIRAQGLYLPNPSTEI